MTPKLKFVNLSIYVYVALYTYTTEIGLSIYVTVMSNSCWEPRH